MLEKHDLRGRAQEKNPRAQSTRDVIEQFVNDIEPGTYLLVDLYESINEDREDHINVQTFTDTLMELGHLVVVLRNTNEEFVIIETEAE